MLLVFCVDDPESGGRILVQQQGGTSTSSSLTGNKDETEVQDGDMGI
jgi:hypothetical protein